MILSLLVEEILRVFSHSASFGSKLFFTVAYFVMSGMKVLIWAGSPLEFATMLYSTKKEKFHH